MADRDVNVNVNGDSSRFQRAMGDASESAGRFSSGMSRGMRNAAIAVGSALAVDRIVDFGSEMLTAGTQVQTWGIKVDTVFGDAASSVRTWADENNEALGMTDEALAGAAAGFGDLLVPLGFTRDRAAEMSTTALDLSGALSAWSGGTASVADVSDRLTAAMLGETDGLKSLGISISAADVQARLAAEGKDQLTGASLQQAQAEATLALILEKSTDAQEAWANGSMDAVKSQNELSATVAELRQGIATGLTPIIQGFVDVLVTSVIPAVRSIAETWGPRLSTAFGFIADNFPIIIAGLGGLAIGIGVTLVPAFIAWATAAGAAAIATVVAAAPVIALGLAVAAVAAGLVYAWQNFDTFRGVVLAVVGAVRTAAVAGFNAIRTVVETVVPIITAIVTTGWEVIRTVVSTAMTVIGTVVSTGWQVISTIVGTAIDVIRTVVVTGWNVISTVVGTVISTIGTVISTGWNAIRTTITTVVGAIRTAITTVFNAIRTYITTVVGVYRTIFTTGWNAIRTAVVTVADAIRDRVVAIFSAIRDRLAAIVGAIRDRVTAIFRAMRDTIVSVADGTRDRVVAVFSAIRDRISALIDAARDAAVSSFRAMRETIVNVADGIRDRVVAIFQAIRDRIGSIIDAATTNAANAFRSMRDTVIQVVDSIRDRAINIFQAMRDRLGGIADTIRDRLTRPFEAMSSAVVGFISAIRSAIGDLVGAITSIPSLPDITPGFDVPGIPFFARGGFVTSPTLLGAGEAGPELILPLTNQARMRELLARAPAAVAAATAVAGRSLTGGGAEPGAVGAGTVINLYVTALSEAAARDYAELIGEELRRLDRSAA